jgi:predicted GH43/DUF377 family glycosyl hydrolase
MTSVGPVIITEGLRPDPARLVAQPFLPGTDPVSYTPGRLHDVVERVLSMEASIRRRTLSEARDRSIPRLPEVEEVWRAHYDLATRYVPGLKAVDDDEAILLIGAYLTRWYAYEAAALTNPSIVPFGPIEEGRQPFVMSGRAIGEGHISSITFITGWVDEDGRVELEPRSAGVSNGRRRFHPLDTGEFAERLAILGMTGPTVERILYGLGDRCTLEDLEQVLLGLRDSDVDPGDLSDSMRRVHWLASSNYDVTFEPDRPISEHLLSPSLPIESRGMEDARFVKFAEEDGTERYYATYTAYDGSRILPQIIETTDFHTFRLGTMSGPAAYHKGVAIFPRRIDGEYVALSRHDHERLFVMFSDDVHEWGNAELVVGPEAPWQLIQLGNCGSPIETSDGWLVITHGVGPMRRYVLGAILLDLDRPEKVIARCDRPLIEPPEDGSFGYVPDVVYSCGGMVHEGLLVLPYGFADYGIDFAVVPVTEVIGAMH